MSTKAVAAVFLLAAWLTGCGATLEPPPIELAPPTTRSELIRNIKQVFDQGLALKPAFYDEANLRRIFAATSFQYSVLRETDPRLEAVYLKVSETIDPPARAASTHNFGIQFRLSRTLRNDRIVEAYVSLTFQGNPELDGLTFDQVVAVTGRGWEQDRKAEEEKFFAVSREPFNPPAKQSRIISYHPDDRDAKGQATLDFGSDGYLFTFYFVESPR